MAKEKGMDLVQVSLPEAEKVVCKIMNFGKQRYDKQKKQHKGASAQKKMKEIKISIKIEKRDLETKINHVIDFLQAGHSVRFIIQLHGRDMQRKEEAFKIMEKVIELLSLYSKPMESAAMVGNMLSVVFVAEKKPKPI